MEASQDKYQSSAIKQQSVIQDDHTAAGETSQLYEELKVSKSMKLISEQMIAGSADYIGSISVVETMFNRINNVIDLRYVHNLIELTLIGTLTTSLQGIETQGHSLEILNVTNCNLTRIESYFLKLEKAFLFSNQIRKIEGLDNNLALKELHLQDNQIKKVDNVSRLVSLQTLLLSQNPIESLDQLSEISKLPNLRQLSFKCEHFDPCPVSELSGYKNYVLSTVLQKDKLQKLDCDKVDQGDFQAAQSEFMEQILKLQENLQEIENEHRHQLYMIDSKEKENEDHLRKMQKEILIELDNLKIEVNEGRSKIMEEIDRYKIIREEAFEQLKTDFESLRDQLDKKVQKIVKHQESQQNFHQVRCQQEIEALEYEKQINLGLIDILYESQGQVIFNELSKESLDFKLFKDIAEQNSSQETMVIGSQPYLTYLNQLEKEQNQVQTIPTSQQQQKRKNSATNKGNQKQIDLQQLQKQYESIIDLRKVFQINEQKKSVHRFSNNQRYFIKVDDSSQMKEYLNGILSEKSLKIHKQINKCMVNQDKENISSEGVVSLNQAVLIIKLQTDLSAKFQNVNLQWNIIFQQQEINMIQHVESTRDASLFMIEAVVVLNCLYARANFDQIIKQSKSIDNFLIDLLTNYSNKMVNFLFFLQQIQDMKLNLFEKQAHQKYIEMEKRIWGEMDGQQILLYQNQSQEITKLRDEAHQLQQMIDKERNSQEAVMKELRMNI
ncbi:leucine-rich repeat-containing protein 9-like [Stylonychia lemnae]|uniref:Leucine-rich repeat-containing protein 9-like n=1 Tax=Stylonychia lemnae TaxID=5949 RepID=A0A078A9J8_STYLE|nr:leucine-rich repeat-containing protein 9-like [Stylonychia lemnae]|eukprot:CDW78940.1 leucine-rich repeat-containing protein 9-like [Stylonychia lemnae]